MITRKPPALIAESGMPVKIIKYLRICTKIIGLVRVLVRIHTAVFSLCSPFFY